MKQLHREPLFQPGNVLTHRRGGKAQLATCLGKAARLGGAHEDVESCKPIKADCLRGKRRLVRRPLRLQPARVNSKIAFVLRVGWLMGFSWRNTTAALERQRRRRGRAHSL